MVLKAHLVRQLTLRLCGVFLLILILEWGILNIKNSDDVPSSIPSDFSQETEQLLSSLSIVQAEDYTVLSATPLFVEGRSPIEKGANESSQSGANSSGSVASKMRLMGLTISAEKSLALVVDAKGTYYRLFVGDESLGWTLKSVQEHSATFSRLGKIITLTLEKHKIGRASKTRKRRAPIIKSQPRLKK
ncbi:MAG: hypothetical protein AB1Y26_07405 [Cycloclasticus sp.]